MNLFFDTETSGLWRDELPPDDPGQPALVQLGAQLFDRQWKRVGHLTTLIKPDGWAIEAEAKALHGINTAQCARYGMPLGAALVAFSGMVAASSRVIAHHLLFDRRVINVSLTRIGAGGVWWHRAAAKGFCTMEEATATCNLPGQFGAKFPSLEEARVILAPHIEPGQHDADSDIAVTVAIYRALIARGVATEATGFNLEIA